MRSPLLRLVPVALSLFSAACGSKGGSGSDSAGPADPNTVVVNEMLISLGGERLGPSPEDKLAKHDALFDKLKEQREKWKTEHPDGKFPGVLTLDLGPSMTVLAALAVYQTAGFAGYPNMTIKQGTTTLEVPCAIPKPPDPNEALSKEKRQDLYMRFLPEGDVELRPGQCGGAYDVVPPASVAATLKEWCGDKGDCLRSLRLGAEPGTPFSKVLPTLVELRKASAKMELSPGGGLCKPGEGPATDRRRTRAMLGDLPFADVDQPRPALPPGTKLPGSQIVEDEVSTTGGAFPEEVRAAMKPKLADFKLCYGTGLLRNPNLQGRVMVILDIGKKGAVMSVGKGRSDLPDNDVAECILEAASGIRLPGKGSIGRVAYVLAMSPK